MLYSYKWKSSYGTKESRTRSACGARESTTAPYPADGLGVQPLAIRNPGIVIRCIGPGPVG
jgi:hypothetical protein